MLLVSGRFCLSKTIIPEAGSTSLPLHNADAFILSVDRGETDYRYHDLSIADNQHRDFDDVRSAVFAALSVEQLGLEAWAGDALNQVRLGDPVPYTDLAERGMDELRIFLNDVGAI